MAVAAHLIRYGFLLLGALVSACAPLTGNQAQDTQIIAKEIVGACLLSPLFKPADIALTAAFPAAILPIDLKNAGVALVCANPLFFAAQNAGTADWVIKVLAPYIRARL